MRKFISILLSLLALMPVAALAQTSPGGLMIYSLRDCGISSLSGSSQNLAVANPNRKYMGVFNSGNATIYVNFAGGTAASTGIASASVVSGGSIVMLPTQGISRNLITVIGTAGQPVACFEGN